MVLLDLSQNGASAHAQVGVPYPRRHLGDRLAAMESGASASLPPLADLAVPGGTPNLRIIAGLPDRAAVPARPDGFAAAVLQDAAGLPCDVVVADLGSGRSRATALACRAAATLLLVTTPEPQSLRGLLHLQSSALQGILEDSLEGKDLAVALRTFSDAGLRGVLSGQQDRSRLYHRILDALGRKRFGLVLNQVRNQEEVQAATRIGAILSMIQAVVVDPVVSLEYDLSVVQTAGEGKVLSQSYPNSPVGRGLERLIAALGKNPDGNRRQRGGERYAPISAWHYYRVLALDPRSSPRDVQRHYEWIRPPFLAGGEAETVASRSHLDDVLGSVETAYRTLLFLENRREYDRELVQAGILERSELRSAEQEDADQRRQMTADEAAATEPQRPAGRPPTEPGTDRSETTDSRPPARPAAPAPAPGAPPAGEGAHEDAQAEWLPAGRRYTGATLRMLRQRRRLDLEKIAEITKIRTHQIEALENDRYGDLPVPVFLRGFLKAYALCLDLEPQQVVSDYMEGYEAWSRMRP